MRKPYFLEKKKIAQAQCEDRRDGIEVEKYRHEREQAERSYDDEEETEEETEEEIEDK